MYLKIEDLKAISTLANDVTSEDELKRIIERAEMDIDRLTNFKIEDFENLSNKIQKAINFAVIAQVEFLLLNGEYASNVIDNGSVSIGSYSTSESSGMKHNGYADSVIQYLLPTGYMYRGVNSVRRSCNNG